MQNSCTGTVGLPQKVAIRRGMLNLHHYFAEFLEPQDATYLVTRHSPSTSCLEAPNVEPVEARQQSAKVASDA